MAISPEIDAPLFDIEDLSTLPTSGKKPPPLSVESQFISYSFNSSEPDKKTSILDWITAVSTFLLTIFTAFLWLVTRDVLFDSAKTAARSQRAYVLPVSIVCSHDGSHITFKVTVQNSGQTPAYKVRCWIASEIVPTNNTSELPSHVLDAEGFLAPNVPLELTVSRPPLTNEQINHLINKQTSIVVYGKITYTDIYRKDRWRTLFRFSGTGLSLISDRYMSRTLHGNTVEEIETEQSFSDRMLTHLPTKERKLLKAARLAKVQKIKDDKLDDDDDDSEVSLAASIVRKSTRGT